MGIEDVNYTVGDDGLAHFVEGEDSNNAAYHTVDFLYGNQFLVRPWEGQDPSIREEAKEQMDNIGYSAYFGFAADTTEVSTQLSAIANVLGQYQAGIDSVSLIRKFMISSLQLWIPQVSRMLSTCTRLS